MPSFTLDENTAHRLREFIAQRDSTLTEFVRSALNTYDSIDSTSTSSAQYSVRLDPTEARKLERLAKRASASKSKTLARLVTHALNDETAQGKRSSTPHRSSRPLPGPRAYEEWATLILDAAQATPETARFGGKVFISAVIEEVLQRTRPGDPERVRQQIRALLPELNRRDLISLHRLDLALDKYSDLTQASELSVNAGGTVVTWHLIDLAPVNACIDFLDTALIPRHLLYRLFRYSVQTHNPCIDFFDTSSSRTMPVSTFWIRRSHPCIDFLDTALWPLSSYRLSQYSPSIGNNPGRRRWPGATHAVP